MSPAVDLAACVAGWDPPAVTVEDSMDPGPPRALAAVLDRPVPLAPVLPALWHWVYFVPWPPTAALGPDGHPTDGDFLPPVPERTRMFVGGRLEVPVGLRTGAVAERRSTVTDRRVKHGSSGSMLFVTVRHELFQDGALALVDEQDLMYRSGAAPRRAGSRTDAAAAAATAPDVADPDGGDPYSTTIPGSDAPWQEPFSAGPALLFRFSALTANSHRIHYDAPYATDVEGYPGLVVHGPLLAVMLAGLAERSSPGRRLTSMRYRLARPVFAGQPALLTGRPAADGAEMAVVTADGATSASAQVGFSP